MGSPIRGNFLGMNRPCSRCGLHIIVTEVMLRNSTYMCSGCWVRASKEYVERNREKKRNWNNAYRKRHPEAGANRTAKFKEKYPQKRAAHQAVQTALRSNKLMKGACEVCGSTKVHAHHDDYSKPLQIRWLCHAHHMELHFMLKAREA